MKNPTIVVKVGGSLFDWPELGDRLGQWLETLSPAKVLLVPGGGPTVEMVRHLDQWHRLGDEAAHWLALRVLTVNAYFLASILASLEPAVIADLGHCEATWTKQRLPILGAFQFAQEDEGQPGCLPHSWSITSDSLAGRVAVRFNAQRLILLKSIAIPDDRDWVDPSFGFVDQHFAKVIEEPGSCRRNLEVSAINFRQWRG